MQTIDINITPKQYEQIKDLPLRGPQSAEKYVEDNLIGSAIKYGYGFYGLEKIYPDKISILIGDSCD